MEKDIIKIGTVNLQNNRVNRRGGLREDGIDTAKLVAEHIEEEQFDILGTQELTRTFVNNIEGNLKRYKLYGDYRYGSSFIVRSIPFINDFNENNNIITSNEVVEVSTHLMPFIAYNPKDFFNSIVKMSIMPRIVTIAIIKIYDQLVCAINTHLDYQIPSIQIRQLNYIKKIIMKYSKKYPIVLTGDFNLEIDVEYFDKFNADLDELNLKRVEVNDKTNADTFDNKTAIDHIFVPKNWEIIDKGISTIDYVTDHLEVFAKVKIR